MTVGPNEIYRVSARFKSTRSGDIVNVFHWRTSVSYSGSESTWMTGIMTELSAMYAAMASHLAEESDPYDIRFDQVQWLFDREQVIRSLGTFTWTLSNPPIGTGDSLPQMNSAILNVRTVQVGVFGRKYLGPIIEGSQQYGSLVATALTALANFGSEWLSGFNTADGAGIPGVLSKWAQPAGDHFVTFNAMQATALLGTQRRRRIMRGS